MKVNAITLRPGHVVERGGKLAVVSKSEIYQPGKGAAVIQVEFRDLKSGLKSNERFRTQEIVERVQVDEYDYQYLFRDGDHYVFMNQDSFEQIPVSGDLIGDPAAFLTEGMICQISTYEEIPLSVALPQQATVTVTETEPVVKGQTASSSYKPTMTDVGIRVMVPPHINVGTRIVVKTADGTYVERAKD